ncbi:MAG: hypothetical protein ABW219_04885 [Ilumatobacteraceae bacterium]
MIGGVGAAATVAAAQEEPAPPASTAPRRAGGEFVCTNLELIQQIQADHAASLTDRLALLGSARSAAEEAGRAEVVARIDRRSAKLVERQAKVAERQQHLADVAANCAATTG